MYHKNLPLISLILFYGIIVQAQQEPQWLLPLYFEDANGDRDTVYLGYDSTASRTPENIEKEFDEGWMWIDTTKFNVVLWIYPEPGRPGSDLNVTPIQTDSVRKKDVTSNISGIGTVVGFVKGRMPVTMKWSDSALYDPGLPFPDISPRPRARIEITCNVAYPCPLDAEVLTLTDYVVPEFHVPITDSLVFEYPGENIEPRKVIRSLFIHVKPHDADIPVHVHESEAKQMRVYPNPFTQSLQIRNPSGEMLYYTLSSLSGKIILSGQTYRREVTLPAGDLYPGVYIFQAKDNTKVYTHKLIKIE